MSTSEVATLPAPSTTVTSATPALSVPLQVTSRPRWTSPDGQIAARLGYANASAFTRAFLRWSGKAPTQWRAPRRRKGG